MKPKSNYLNTLYLRQWRFFIKKKKEAEIKPKSTFFKYVFSLWIKFD